MTKESTVLRHEAAFNNQANEEGFELENWHISLIKSRLKTANESVNGLEHNEVFRRLRQGLQAVSCSSR